MIQVNSRHALVLMAEADLHRTRSRTARSEINRSAVVMSSAAREPAAGGSAGAR